MLPAPALGHVTAKVATCEIDASTFFRLRLTPDASGVFVLHRVEILIIGNHTLSPSPWNAGGPVSCATVLPELLPVTVDPSTAGYIGTCEIEPLVRGHTHNPAIRIWARVPVDVPVASFPDDIHCWELARYLGAPRGAPSLSVPCIFN
jgi:hypothetical protein